MARRRPNSSPKLGKKRPQQQPQPALQAARYHNSWAGRPFSNSTNSSSSLSSSSSSNSSSSLSSNNSSSRVKAVAVVPSSSKPRMRCSVLMATSLSSNNSSRQQLQQQQQSSPSTWRASCIRPGQRKITGLGRRCQLLLVVLSGICT